MDNDDKLNGGSFKHFPDDDFVSLPKLAVAEDNFETDFDPVLLKGAKDVNQICTSGDTLLHQLVKRKGNFEQDQKYLDCIQALIDGHADVNFVDRDGFTALFWAARNRHTSVVRLLLEQNPIDIDTLVGGTSARKLIEDLGISTSQITEFTANNKLQGHLMEGWEDEFVACACQLENIYHANRFLVEACRAGLSRVAEYLISHLVTFPTLKDNWLLFNLSCRYGLSELLEITLAEELKLNCNEVLANLLMRCDENPLRISDFRKCCKVFMSIKGRHIDVDGKYKGYTPIQYSIVFEADDVITALLQRTTFLSQNDKLHIGDVSYEDMNDYFDYCITENEHQVNFNYKMLVDDYKENEVKLFRYITNSAQLSPLITHPLISTLINIKWEKMWWIFYANFAFSLIFCLSLLLFIFMYYIGEDNTHPTEFFVFLLITNTLSSVRELLQFYSSPKLYVQNFENYVEIAINFIVYLILFNDYSNSLAKRQISAVVILLIAFELLFTLGKHPYLSTNITMFRSISFAYIHFLLFYFTLILGFALCFYLLYGQHDKNSSFNNPFMALFKTFLMLKGELDSRNAKLDQYPVVGHFIFLLFIFSVSIILVNLLNGLAVSGVQTTRNKAKVLVLKSRIEYIAYIETLLGNFTATPIKKSLSKFTKKNFHVNGHLVVVCHNMAKCQRRNCQMVHLDQTSLDKTKVILRRKLDNQLSLREKRKNEECMEKLTEMYDTCNTILINQKKIHSVFNKC